MVTKRESVGARLSAQLALSWWSQGSLAGNVERGGGRALGSRDASRGLFRAGLDFRPGVERGKGSL